MNTSNIIWTSKEIATVTGGCCKGDWSIVGISTDSREVQNGDLFVVLTDEGHHDALSAIENGATGVLCERLVDGIDSSKIIIVDDVVGAMEALANAGRSRVAAKFIGISTQENNSHLKTMLSVALSEQGQVHSNSSIENVTSDLMSMHAGTDYALFNMNMGAEAFKLVQPDVVIMNDSDVSFDDIKSSSIVILNRDAANFDALKNKAQEKSIRVISFGEHTSADARITECLEAANGVRIRANILHETIECFIPISGSHVAGDTIATLTAVRLLGADIETAIQALSKQECIEMLKNREFLSYGQPHNPVTLIDESRNASPDTMRAAFKVLALVDPGRGGRRIAVLGGMLGCSNQNHADLALPLKAANIDLVYTCGQKMKNLYDNLPANQQGSHEETSEDLAQIVPEVLVPGDVLMVKGSRESEMDAVVEALRSLPEKMKSTNVQKG